MTTGLELLGTMAYPGRIIILGQNTQGQHMVMYAITGRSPSSQARQLVINAADKLVSVEPTDEETLKTGQVDLLIYSALFYDKGIIIGNGKQTDGIKHAYATTRHPVEVLLNGQSDWDYESDGPNFTPRISGCITEHGAALSIIKRAENGANIKHFFDVPLIDGKGSMISTYTGENESPLPSFSGEPKKVSLTWDTASEGVEALYDALKPQAGQPDYRVVALCALVDSDGNVDVKVKNRHS